MLKLVDQSPDRLAILAVPHEVVRTDEIDDVERIVIREYDRAKGDRPDLGVKPAPGPTAEYPNAAILIAIHEHQWSAATAPAAAVNSGTAEGKYLP